MKDTSFFSNGSSAAPNGARRNGLRRNDMRRNGVRREEWPSPDERDLVTGARWVEALLTKLRHRPLDSGEQRVLKCIAAHRRLLLLGLLFSGVGAALEGLGIGLLVPFLENLTDPTAEAWRTGWAWFDRYVLVADASRLRRLYQISCLILLVIISREVLGYIATLMQVRAEERIVDSLRGAVVKQLQSLSLRFYSTTRTGHLINAITSEMHRLRLLFGIASTMTMQTFMLLAYAGVILWLSWKLSLFVFLACGLLLWVLTWFLAKLKDDGREISHSNGRVASAANDLIGGMRTIIAFGTEAFEAKQFGKISTEAAEIAIRARKRNALVSPISKALASLTLIVMVIAAYQLLVLEGAMSAAALLAFLFALFRLLPIVQMLNGARAQWAVEVGALETVAGLLRREDKPILKDGWRSPAHLHDSLVMEEVTFSYEKGQPVLKGIDLRIECGQMVAIVGASGAGKSTLADLAARFYDPDEGRVLLDGIDLREYRLQALRQKIAVVSQDTYLFNDTVRANIAYGLSDVSDETLREVAFQANALSFIEALPQGWETVLGERGARLSGGQRQRIAIARALLRDPELLILDEATSALDSVSERLIQDSLERLMEGRTVIVIAHRLSTVEGADQVVVLEEGQIVEQGTYRDLLEGGVHLRKYHELQLA